MCESNDGNNMRSFWKHLEKYNAIQVPVIQRDYAQGRRGSKKAETIRNNLLKDIKKSINNNERMCLDFIYGSSESDGTIKLIDGQQRFTTLFLLHWYFASKANRDNEQIDEDGRTILEKFTYQTRDSSTEFCKALCESKCGGIWNEDNKQDFSLEATIKDLNWFREIWINDPTVDSMLNMINSIHNIFKDLNADETYKKLKYEDVIVMQFLKIDDFGDSEDLYVKMNARGKPLTDFENFKAQFGGLLNEKSKIDNNWNIIRNKYWMLIDGDCSTFLWEFVQNRYRLKRTQENEYVYKVDNTLMSYIWLQVEMLTSYINHDLTKDDFFPDFYYSGDKGKPIINFEYILNDDDTKKNIKDCQNVLIRGSSPEELIVRSIENIKGIFDCISEVFDKNISDNSEPLVDVWLNDHESIFDRLIPFEKKNEEDVDVEWPKRDYITRILVFAIICWCNLYGVPEDKTRLVGYIRLIRNILKRFRSKKSASRKWDPELGKYECGKLVFFIINDLIDNEKDSSNKALELLKHENSKSYSSQIRDGLEQETMLISLQEDIRNECLKIEDTKLFTGNILPLLQNELYITFNETKELFYPSSKEHFVKLSKALMTLSNDDSYFRIPSGEKSNNEIRIAFCDTTNESFDAWSLALLYKGYRGDLSEKIRGDNIRILKALISKLRQYKEKTIDEKLDDIIDNYLNENSRFDWKYYFIKYGSSVFVSNKSIRYRNGTFLPDMPTLNFDINDIYSCTTSYNISRFLDETLSNVIFIMVANKWCEDNNQDLTDCFIPGASETNKAQFLCRSNCIEAWYDVVNRNYVINNITIDPTPEFDIVTKIVELLNDIFEL